MSDDLSLAAKNTTGSVATTMHAVLRSCGMPRPITTATPYLCRKRTIH